MKIKQILEARLASRWIPSKFTNYWFSEDSLDRNKPEDQEYYKWIRTNEKLLDNLYTVLENIWYQLLDRGNLHDGTDYNVENALHEYYTSNPPNIYKELDLGPGGDFVERAIAQMWEVLDES